METLAKIAQITKAARQLFLNEHKEKFLEIMITFLNLRLYKKQDELAELETFFHSLNGTAATIELNGISELGREMEEYIGSTKKETLSEEFFLKLLDGLARLYEALQENLTETDNGRDVTDDIKIEERKAAVVQTKKRILLIDDVNLIHYLVQNLLPSDLYEVFSAKTGEEGLRKSREMRPDLMIVDLMLPGMDGFEVCRQTKNEPATRDTKIIVLSAKNKKEDVVKCFEMGADDYMVKPFSAAQLHGRINKLLFD